MPTIPTQPGFSNMRAVIRSSSKLAISPFNFTQQVYSWKGKIRVVDFTLPPMLDAQAEDWIDFFEDCNGFEGVFTVDISDAFPNDPSANAVPMRLADPDQEWDINTLVHYGITFRAMEAL